MNWKPNRKIGMAAGVGTPLAVIAAWGLGLTGVEVPAEITAALSSIITFAIGYVVREA